MKPFARGRLLLALAVAAGVIAVSGAGLFAGVFSGFRLQASDALFPVGDGDPRVVVVGVDQQALAETGLRWPWPRDTQARLVEAIADAKPRVVVIDVVYQPAGAADDALAAALKNTDAVVASAPQLSTAVGGRLYEALSVVQPVPVIAGAAKAVGHGGITPDGIDGVVRTLPLVVDGPDHEFVPSLSLAAIARFDAASDVVTLRPHGAQIGTRYVPTDRRARLRVAYPSNPTGDRMLSAADVLAGRVSPDKLRGKVVVVGVTDPTLGDYHATPVDKGNGAPGVLIHAAAIDTMLTHNYLTLAATTQTFLWLVALVLIVALATALLRVWLSTVISVAALVGYLAIAFVRLDGGTEMDLVWPPVAALLAFIAAIVTRLVVDAADRRRMSQLLEQYVPAPVARQLLERGRKSVHVGSGTITFLFTDVVGSTEAWERYPQLMGAAMRRHDELIETAVERGGGALVRPRGEGDSRFAVFLDAADGGRAALAAGDAIGRESWATPEPIQVRMGLHTGEAEERDGDYYGSPVNRCARIRGLAEPGEVLVSTTTAALIENELPAGSLVDRGSHGLKGFEEPEHVFALVDLVGTSRPR